MVSAPAEHPDIRYVVYPVHMDGTRTGKPPRMRHDPDCGHFDWGTGEMLGTPELATAEQMKTLGACETCVGTRSGPEAGTPARQPDGRLGNLCPTCHQTMSLTGICDNCY